MTRFERVGSVFAGFVMALATATLLFPDMMRALIRWMT